jgi:hypothetical protein
MHSNHVPRAALLAALLTTSIAAMAGLPDPHPAPSTHGAGFGPPVAPEALSGLRGGDSQSQVTVEVDNQGTVQGNTASQVVAGDNRVDGGAFANAAGLTTVIQNSGSNVLIQNGTSVNVRFGGP